MYPSTAFAPGKIILSGEYSMVFGHPGIAVPTKMGMHVSFQEATDTHGIEIQWDDLANYTSWRQYIKAILQRCTKRKNIPSGLLEIKNKIPLGKGMGSSTALVIAVTKCLLESKCEEDALTIEDELNFGHSGMDFSVIWLNEPIHFSKKEGPRPITLPENALSGAFLVDTGKPNETTVDLVAWIREREQKVSGALDTIADCAKRLAEGEELHTVMQDHHKAQVELGVVPEKVQTFISEIENKGGSAKVIGAGGRTGGGGMVLALGVGEDFLSKHPFIHSPLSL